MRLKNEVTMRLHRCRFLRIPVFKDKSTSAVGESLLQPLHLRSRQPIMGPEGVPYW
jgi:hypothetical protein